MGNGLGSHASMVLFKEGVLKFKLLVTPKWTPNLEKAPKYNFKAQL